MRILHLDIETSPNTAYVWGVYQQFIPANHLVDSGYTMCWSAKWHGKPGVMFSSVFHETEEEMLSRIWCLLDEADAVVHYNGQKFDIPTLNKEFLRMGFTPPSPYKQIDLLKVVRSNFKFPSYKLEYVSQALGIGAKVKHLGIEMWEGCMEGDPACWKTMEKYNRRDTTLLEKLYKELRPWIKEHPNYGMYTDPKSPACPNCGGKVHSRGVEHTKTQSYRRYCCTKCGAWSRGRYTVATVEQKTNALVKL